MKIILAVGLLLFLLTDVNFGKKSGNQCSTNRKYGSKTYELFGVRTLYEHVRHELPSSAERSPTNGCTPIHVYILARHGARLPHTGNYRRQNQFFELIQTLNNTGKAKLCTKDIEALRNWKPWVDEFVDKNQTEYGDSEIRGIARRFITLLPELFPSRASPASYRFMSSDYQRTIASMRVFAEEILKRGRVSHESLEEIMNSADFQVNPLEDDSILRFQATCRKYVVEVHKNSSTYDEYKEILNGPKVRRIMHQVASRLGIRRASLTPKFLYSLYLDGCALQQWVDTENGPWCSIFSKKNLEVLDYVTDVKEYEVRKTDNPITATISCDLVKDIMSTLKESASSDENHRYYPMGSFLFGHVTTVISTAANLALYKDPKTPLRANNYRRHRKRAYAMSTMIPSAGNLAFVLYKCGSDYKVQIFWNEKLIKVPACADDPMTSTLCPLDKVLRFYQDFVPGSPTECNFDELCENEA